MPSMKNDVSRMVRSRCVVSMSELLFIGGNLSRSWCGSDHIRGNRDAPERDHELKRAT